MSCAGSALLALAQLGKSWPPGAAGAGSLRVQAIAANPSADHEPHRVTPSTFLALLPVIVGLFAAQPGVPQTVSRLVVQDELILRVFRRGGFLR